MNSAPDSALNEIGYNDWQALIRLPSLVLYSFYLDSSRELFFRRLTVSIDYLLSSAQHMKDIILSQLITDALEELPKKFNENLQQISQADIAACAVSVETARKALSENQFKTYCQTILEIIDRASAVSSWKDQFIQYIPVSGKTAVMHNVEAVRIYFQGVTAE